MIEENSIVESHEEDKSPESQTIVGVRFRSCGKMYTFDVNNVEVKPGARVIVDSEAGLSLGRVVTPRQITEKSREPLKKIVRIANEADFEKANENRALEQEAREYCTEMARELKLKMKIVATETTIDNKRMLFYFTADGRIDFRELVRNLASRFKTRIEMRQIGVRDEVKILGGFGCCGRQTCCSLFLTSFAPVTIKMAKEQSLTINQSKLSGVCGRLMCCLGYEKYPGGRGKRRPGPDRGRRMETGRGDDKSVKISAAQGDKGAGPAEQVSAGTSRPEAPAPARPSRVPDKEGDKTKKPSARYVKRRKRHKARKTTDKAAPDKSPKTPAPQNEQGKDKAAAKKRRRRFWKKKQADKS